jgi:hypothetical protein
MITLEQANINVETYYQNLQQEFFNKIEDTIVQASSRGFSQCTVKCYGVPIEDITEAINLLEKHSYKTFHDSDGRLLGISWGKFMNPELAFYSGP